MKVCAFLLDYTAPRTKRQLCFIWWICGQCDDNNAWSEES